MKLIMSSIFALLMAVLFSVTGFSMAQEISQPKNAEVDARKASTIVVKSRIELDEVMVKGPTPLDALTPFGKREFLSHLRWGERGLGGFSRTAPLRELERDQAWAVFAMFGLTQYFPKQFPQGKPLRFDHLSADVEKLVQRFDEASDQDFTNKGNAGATQTGMPLTADLYRRELKDLLAIDKLRNRGDGDLYLLFQCAQKVNFALPDEESLANLNRVYFEFIRRGVDTRRELDPSMFTAMLRSRDLVNAKKFVQSHPAFAAEEVPKVVDSLKSVGKQETVLVERGDKWVRQVAPFKKKGTQLVIVLSDGCGFCRQLMKDIDSDTELRSRFEQAHTLLITDPSDTSPFEFVRVWNKSHAHLPMYIPFSAKEWERFDKGRVPQFVIIRNNRIVHNVFSWQKDGSSKLPLLELLDKVGL